MTPTRCMCASCRRTCRPGSTEGTPPTFLANVPERAPQSCRDRSGREHLDRNSVGHARARGHVEPGHRPTVPRRNGRPARVRDALRGLSCSPSQGRSRKSPRNSGKRSGRFRILRSDRRRDGLVGGGDSLPRTRLPRVEFPANREKNREYRRIRGSAPIHAQFGPYFRALTREFPAHTNREFLVEQGIKSPEQGIRTAEQGTEKIGSPEPSSRAFSRRPELEVAQ
jgi:hypothetical protein